MTDQERQAVMTLVLMAAFADDRNETSERQEVKRIADSLTTGDELNVAALYQMSSEEGLDRSGDRGADRARDEAASRTTVRGRVRCRRHHEPAERTFLAASSRGSASRAPGCPPPRPSREGRGPGRGAARRRRARHPDAPAAARHDAPEEQDA